MEADESTPTVATSPSGSNSNKTILDLSKKCLKKVPKSDDAQSIKILILDDNELQKIDNIDSYLRIEKLSLCKNQLLRMYGVCRLHYLRELNLSYNGILTIEGLKELTQIVHLNLEGNNIKTIEHLNTNLKLEVLNLAENSIGSISDMAYLRSLKELYLHGNRLSHLRQCDRNLPISLEVLSLAKNNITDLNEICTLSHLSNLQSFSVSDNPCVQMTGNVINGFDYRPFVLNWLMSLKLIDGFVVNAIESLKAEWLYSQGRGRQFRVGEQQPLAKYLSSVCPLSGEALENENERKLRLILSKAQQHQRQLQEEISGNDTNTSGSNSPSSARKKGANSRIQSPRFSRLGGRLGSPDSSMSSSFCGVPSNNNDSMTGSVQMSTSLIDNIKNDAIMTQSLDPIALSNNQKNIIQQENYMKAIEQNHHVVALNSNGPLAAASKMVPVPESLMSPDCYPGSIGKTSSATVIMNNANNSMANNVNNTMLGNKNNSSSKSSTKGSPKISRHSPHLKRHTAGSLIGNDQSSPVLGNNRKLSNNRTDNIMKYNKSTNHSTPPLSSDEDSDHINIDKLKTIRNKAAQRNQQQKEHMELSHINVNKMTENSAILIQKMWRGFHTRKKTRHLVDKLQKKRTHEYIVKLSQDMEMTKAALENERKIQQLQMQAINALWKKVSQMGPSTTTNVTPLSTESGVAASSGVATTSATCADITDSNSTAIVQDLAKTCSQLTNQVQQLQGSMRDVLNCMTLFCNLSQHSNLKQIQPELEESPAPPPPAPPIESKYSCSTQTEIVAVITPQVDMVPFPFTNKLPRPSTLPLDSTATSPPKLIAGIGAAVEAIEAIETCSDKSTADDSELCTTVVMVNGDESSSVRNTIAAGIGGDIAPSQDN